MRRAPLVLLLAVAACGKAEDPSPAPAPAAPASKAPVRPPPPVPSPLPDLEALRAQQEAVLRDMKEKLEKAGVKLPPALERIPSAPRYVPAGPHVPPPADPVAPRTGLSANGSDVAELPRGWPLVLRFRVHPDPRAAVALPAQDGSWANLVRLETDLPLTPGPRPSGALALEGAAAGELVWTAGAPELDALPRGVLTVAAVLEAPGGPVRTTARIALIEKTKGNTDFRRAHAEVEFLLLRGRAAEALAVADALAPKRAMDAFPQELRARALEALGRREDAAAAYDRAAELAARRRQPTRRYALERDRLRAR